MASRLEVPQTPSAKLRFDDDDDDGDEENDIIDGLASVAPDKESRELKPPSTGFLEADALRRLSVSPFSEFELAQLSPGPPRPRAFSPPPGQPLTRTAALRKSCLRFWVRNKAVIFVFVAQLFGALMNLAARLLELEGEGMHPLQLLFARMSITTLLSCLYMYWKKVPDFPLGAREVRWLLVGRGLSGFFGIFGMWYSMMYLPLAEATVITFLVPSCAGYICHVLLHDPYTRKEQIASLLAFAGVILIAHPASLFSSDPATPPPPVNVSGNTTQPLEPPLGGNVAPSERLAAIGVALLGVLGGSGAFTTIRAIGKRAHPLVSVNYFSTWCTVVSTVVLTFAPVLGIGQPGLRFGFPHTFRQWCLLAFICICGFCTQFLMTAGLGLERSNRATAMVYTHMLFAATFDKLVFNHEMGLVSLFGCGLIIGSALWAAVSKKSAPEGQTSDTEAARSVVGLETVPMLTEEDSEDDENGIPLERVR